MLANVFTKSVRDRWVGIAVAMALVGAFLVLGMAAYREIDLSIYTELPEAIRSVMGIPDAADPATLAYNVMYGFIGSLTLAGLAISMGASAVAGEERDGTIAVLLGNPRSRRQVLVAKAGGLLGLVAVGALLALGSGYLAPLLLGVETGTAAVPAVVAHLFLNALLWGAMALAIGAVTGNRAAASGVSAGVMVLSYFLVGLLPLIDAVADVAVAVPWYWFDGHDPLIAGFSAGYAALQVGTIGLLATVAWWGVEARDLRQGGGDRSPLGVVVDRLRSDERAARVLDRLSGSARVRNVFAKASAEGRALVTITAGVMFGMMGVLMGVMYAAISGTLASLSAGLPEPILVIAGGGDLSTPEGWYRLETFGLMTPIATTLVAAAVGIRALAGEERARTMGLLLANPISRRTIVLQKAAAMAVHAGAIGAATFAGVAAGSVLAGLGMSIANIAATSLHATLLGLMFGALGLALGAATGDVRVATLGTIGVASTAYAANAVLSVVDRFDAWARISPFRWYLGNDPLLNGLDVTSVALFLAGTGALVVLAVALFDRRDLRQA